MSTLAAAYLTECDYLDESDECLMASLVGYVADYGLTPTDAELVEAFEALREHRDAVCPECDGRGAVEHHHGDYSYWLPCTCRAGDEVEAEHGRELRRLADRARWSAERIY